MNQKSISVGRRAARLGVFAFAVFAVACTLRAQDKGGDSAKDAKPGTDVLIFNNGEKLIGHLERVVGTSIIFKSEMAGEVKVDTGKVKELHTSGPFAVIGEDVQLHKNESSANIPQGVIAIADQKVQVNPVTPAPAKTVPLTDTGYIVDEKTFTQNLLTKPGIFQDWKGSVTAGASLVLATQKNRTFTSAVSLVRTIPNEDWLQLRNRTTLNFNSAYGSLSQPNTPTIKTSLYHADFERDEYFSPRLYYFGSGAWDHNISQGLDLQQTYGAGVGWTVIKNAIQQLDLKASVDYINQAFNPLLQKEATGTAPPVMRPPYSHSLIGSVFGQTYNRKFAQNILLSEFLTITPTWNDLNAYSANAGVNLSLPIYKNLGITIGSIDTFLNNPAGPGFKKNSFQFTAGITYTLP